jgi:hypothetical protein
LITDLKIYRCSIKTYINVWSISRPFVIPRADSTAQDCRDAGYRKKQKKKTNLSKRVL